MDFDPRTYGEFPLLQISPTQAAEARRQRFLNSFYRATLDNFAASHLPATDPSELAIAVEQPAPDKPAIGYVSTNVYDGVRRLSKEESTAHIDRLKSAGLMADAVSKPNNIFTDLPLSDLQAACKKIMTPKWMEY